MKANNQYLYARVDLGVGVRSPSKASKTDTKTTIYSTIVPGA